MKRLILLVVLSGVCGLTAANSPSEPGNGSNGNRWDNVGHGHHGSDSSVDSVESNSGISDSDSNAIARADTVVQIKREYEAVAETISSLNLSYCQTGLGAANKDASFNIGGLDYPCAVAASIPQMLSAIAPLMKAAEGYPVGSEGRDRHLNQARNILNRVYGILGEDLPTYIENEGTFSLFWGITKNIIAPILLILVI